MLKVFVLGRFEVVRDGQPVTVWGGRQTRDFVKVLLATRGRPLAREELVELLWEDPPPRAERDLKVLASRARRALGDGGHAAIVSTATGYAFAGRCWVDADELERLVADGGSWQVAGRPALAEASYAKATELYRGPFLAEDLYADWATPLRERYRRLYLEALRALGGLLSERGAPGAAVAADRLLAEDPYADSAVQAVMLARAAAGDASAALDAYARFQQRVLEELGASPSPETERLHTAILREEPLGGWPREAPPRADSRVRPEVEEQPLVGRTREREVLLGALERAAAGEAGAVILVGEPGIGKTRLLRALIALAGERFHVLQATAREREQHLPFQLLAEAIRSLAVAPDELQRGVGPYVDALTELAPELRAILGEAKLPSLPEVARRRVLEGALHLLRSLSEGRPVLVALDDLHWADPSSIDALLFCARRLTPSRLLWAVAIRLGEPGPVLDAVRNLPGAQVLELGPLSTAEVQILLGGVPGPLAAQVAAESGGVPFYVLEVARGLAEASANADLPESIRRAVGRRIERLGPASRQLLEVAAVLGGGFDVQTAAALAEIPVGVGLAGLEELVARRLLVESGDASGRFEFVHDLIRRAAYQSLGRGRQRLLHGRVVDLRLGKDAAVVGRHALQAGRLDRAAQLFRDAGDAALAEHATREAEELYAAALDAAHQARLGRAAVLELLDRIGRARAAHGDYAAAAEAHRSALALAPDERAAARQTVRLGWVAYYQHQPERAVELGREAERRGDAETRGEGLLLQAKLAHADGQVERGASLVAQAAQLVGADALPEVRALEVAIANHRGRYGEAMVRFEAAADGLRRAGLLRPLASAMVHAGVALSGRGAYGRALTLLEESALQCHQSGAEHLEARVHNTLAGIYRQLGQVDRADEQYARAADLATRSGFSEALAHAWVGRAERAMDAGNLSAVHALLDQADAIVHDRLVFYSWRIRLRWDLVRGRLALLEGRPEVALEAAQQVAQAASQTASPKYEVLARGLRADALGPAEDGPAEARAALDLALRLDAPPLVCEAATILGRLTFGSEAEHARQMARATLEKLAASLPDQLGRSLVAHAGIAL